MDLVPWTGTQLEDLAVRGGDEGGDYGGVFILGEAGSCWG